MSCDFFPLISIQSWFYTWKIHNSTYHVKNIFNYHSRNFSAHWFLHKQMICFTWFSFNSSWQLEQTHLVMSLLVSCLFTFLTFDLAHCKHLMLSDQVSLSEGSSHRWQQHLKYHWSYNNCWRSSVPAVK